MGASFQKVFSNVNTNARYVKFKVNESYSTEFVGLGKVLLLDSNNSPLFSKVTATKELTDPITKETSARLWLEDGIVIGDKFYSFSMLIKDDDLEYPTICGTGTEDYFCGSYNFENKKTGQYQEFTTPYAGFHQVIKPDGLYQSQQRFGMYRWHITDPIRFDKKLRVKMQVLGWRRGFKYHARQDDVASVAFWYQTLPTKKFPPFYDIEYLEVI